MFVHLSKVSSNKKTGPIPVSTSGQETCPSSCMWKTKGCYAKYGKLGLHWRNVSNGTNKNVLSWKEFCNEIAKLPRKILWRHNQAGDLPGTNRVINRGTLNELVHANKKGNKRGFTYTHKPVLGDAKYIQSNRDAIKQANENGFTINLSADNLVHADKLAALGIGPVVTILPSDAPIKGIYTPEGRKVVVCPAEWNENITCANCELCAISSRKSIVGFRAHGSAAKTVSQITRLNIVE